MRARVGEAAIEIKTPWSAGLAISSRSINIDGFYLTSIQVGFDPWQGGQGLAIESFRATADAR